MKLPLFKRSADSTATADMMVLSTDTNGKRVPKPVICLIDTDTAVSKELAECGLTTSPGTLGTPVSVPNEWDEKSSSHDCLPNHLIPPNLHEYDIVIVDVRDIEPKKYIDDEHERVCTTGTSSTCFHSAYPETVFDPRPYGATQVRSSIAELVEKGGLLIVFAGRFYTIEYRSIIYSLHSAYFGENETRSIYDFIPVYISINTKHGEKISIEMAQGPLSNLLSRYCEKCQYHAIIHEPKNKGDLHFVPLLRNSSHNIVGCMISYGNGKIIILPDIQDKPTFLRELLMNELPGQFPSLYPYHTESRWLEESSYYLPNQEKLITEKNDAVEEFERRIDQIEQRIAENVEKYSWLHGLLKQDGGELVRNVQKFLEWLEFDAVRYMDDPDKKIQEEDLQVDIPQGLLVIEVKGITGTSKDEDCSQINKIKYRRAKERNSFDVYALYIVNHQKHLPPLERDNPPFKPEQISDAHNEERGLLTTWQLFNLYFSVEAGGITKEEARKSLIESGLIIFKPHDCEELGKPIKVLKDRHIVLFDTKIPISISDSLIILRDERYYKVEILSLESKDRSIQTIESGPVGIKINHPAKKSDLFLLKRSS